MATQGTLRGESIPIQSIHAHNETAMSLSVSSFIFPITSANILRKFSRNFRWRTHAITLQPHCDIEIIGDNEYRSIGHTPQFFLQSSYSSPPIEWVLLRGKVSANTPLRLELFFFDPNGNISKKNKISLKVNPDGKIKELIRIPNNASKIRLDLQETKSNFTIKDLSIKEKGLWQIALWHIKIRLKIIILTDYQELFRILRRGIEIYKSQGWKGIMLGLDRDRQQLGAKAVCNTQIPQLSYNEWLEKNNKLTATDIISIKRQIGTFKYRTKFSIIMPVYKPYVDLRAASARSVKDCIELRATIDSVLEQLYQDWELCIADEASSAPHIKNILAEYESTDKRIRLTTFSTNGTQMAKAANTALQMTTGEYVISLNHGDLLTEHALFLNALEINKYPELIVGYSDEDKIDAKGQHHDPYFKPDWNPLLLLGQNYFNHLTVFRTDTVKQAEGFCENYEGCHDWDLILRITENCTAEQIRHIPHILYHCLVTNSSTGMAIYKKNFIEDATKRTLSAHFKRKNKQETKISIIDKKYCRFRFPISEPFPLVSIIIPTRNQYKVLSQCIDSIIRKTDYANLEIIIIDNQSNDKQTIDYFGTLSTIPNIRIIKYDAPFNYSAINNFAVKQAKGDILAFLNNDIEVITRDWLLEMVCHAIQPNCGAVGCMLYYPDNTIQHAGVILGVGGVAGHAYLRKPRGYSGQRHRARLTQNLSAVTAACMLLKKSVFEEVNGFNEKDLAIAFNDTDLCLRIIRRGYQNVFTPFAELYHHESLSRGYEDTIQKQARFSNEANYMRLKWGNSIDNDPAFNPNLEMNANKWIWGTTRVAPKPWRQHKTTQF